MPLFVLPLFVLAVLAGVCCLQGQAALPADGLLAVLLGLVLLQSLGLWIARWRRRLTLLLCVVLGLTLGFVYASWRASLRLQDALPLVLEGQDIPVTGVIASMPQQIERGWRFDFVPDRSAQAQLPALISLAWYASGYRGGEVAPVPPLEAGQRWQFTVRLKRPHGNVNPHGFDYEAYLFERGVRATGYVRPQFEQQQLAVSQGFWIERQRQAIRARFATVLGEREYGGVLTALAIGDQQAIPRAQWDMFARTGITHLISISGLHITMLAGMAYALVNLLWRRSRWLMLRLPAQQAAVLGGLLAAGAYCLLAGFAVPAQRTLYMLAVVALALWQRRHVSAVLVLSWALLVVVLLDPWAVLAPGFWLSFSAVALLFYVGAGRLGRLHWLSGWVSGQWAITLGMVPLLLALFRQFSLVSPLANAVAIPLVSFVITPLALLATVPGLAFLLLPAHDLLALMMRGMAWLAAWPYASWQQAAQPAYLIALAVLGCLWLFLPRGFPARWLGGVPLLVLLLAPVSRPAAGDWQVTTLDVGQGLAVHVQTAEHDLLFDTGPAFSDEADSGNRIILPYLHAMGVTMLDGLIVSHADNDHAGGAASVIEGMPVAWMQTSVPFENRLSALAVEQQPCVGGTAWEWDGVRFEMLHPDAASYTAAAGKSNDMSCVLKISNAHGSMLLTGDIEAKSERALLSGRKDALQADVLLVPHHGSKSSSTPEFISAVGAQTAIFTVGYRNHYHHPHPDVWSRYMAATPQLYRSDFDGALTVRYSEGGYRVSALRHSAAHYWYGR